MNELRMSWLVLLLAISGWVQADDVIAVVNGEEIHASAVQWQFFQSQLNADDATEELHRQVLENVIDRHLIEQFLAKRKIEADGDLVEHQVTLVKKLIEAKGGNVDEILGNLGLTEEALRGILAQSLAWKQYVAEVVTKSQVEEEFKAHRKQYDGTRAEITLVTIPLDPETSADITDDWTRRLRKLKRDGANISEIGPPAKIETLKLEYNNRNHPLELRTTAFALSTGDVSDPFQTERGVHMVQLLKFIPGQLSLEDARSDVMKQLSEQLWQKRVSQLRASARIQILETPNP